MTEKKDHRHEIHEQIPSDSQLFSYRTGGGDANGGRIRTQLNRRVAYLPPGTSTQASNLCGQSPDVNEPTSAPVPIPFPIAPLDQSSSLPTTNISVFTPPDFHRPDATPPLGSPPSQLNGKVDISKVPNIDANEMLADVEAKILEKLKRVQPAVSGRKLEDIKRRLDVMRNQWRGGQLSETTRKRMYLLAQSTFAALVVLDIPMR
ncbi:steroid receptor RNA activator 1-like [Tropilaelaps mercedesae]|uniref:Steroid receptor RNA activator 1-like n=1 Tax=Tropilaelaps mercedesae TaxID=418985 RepID=A0A1V9WY61_9ACAR|nr:steroid receptor RNA activator 1-like [Tropilaelaps mercedesae]